MPASKPAVLTATDTPVEAHLRRVIETQPVCLTRISADGVFLAVNEAALSMLGAERLDRILGTSLLALVAPAHHDACRTFLKRIAAGGRGSTELEMKGLGGLEHVLQLHAVALSASLDAVPSILCTFRDVTEHRRLESALVDVAERDQAEAERETEWADLTAELDSARAAAGADEQMAARVGDLERQLTDVHAQQQELAAAHERERARLLGEVQSAEQRFEQALKDQLSQVSEIEGALREAQGREHALVERHASDEAQWRQALADATAEHERQTAALRQAIAELEHTVDARHRGDADLQQQLAAAVAGHEQQTADLRAAIARLESALAEATERALQLTAAHEADRAEWDRQSQQQTAAHDAERAEWDQKLATALDAERVAGEQRAADLARERAELDEQARQLAGSLDAERSAWEQRAADLAREHEGALIAERSRADAASGELQAVRDEAFHRQQEQSVEIERLEAMLAGAAAESASLGTRLSAATLERTALERQLDRALRLTEAGRVAASLAGDLDSTLAAITRSSRSLVDGSLPDPLRPAADQIVRGIAEAREIVRQLARTAARAGGAGDVDAVAVIRQLEPALASLLGPKITLSIITAAEQAPVAVSADDLEQVLLALIGNRRATMKSGGQVTIEIAGVEIDDDCAQERGGVLPGPYLLVAIHTSGRGVGESIPAEMVGRPVPDGAWRGAGAGLNAVARIVTGAGGHVWLAREGDEALAFELYLPGADDRSAARIKE